MKSENKTIRFVNLAEQLTMQNDIVSSTMDSMLKFVSENDNVETRSDFPQIQKTAQQVQCEMSPAIESGEPGAGTSMPRPKMKGAQSNSAMANSNQQMD